MHKIFTFVIDIKGKEGLSETASVPSYVEQIWF